jgi:hypothetical protein
MFTSYPESAVNATMDNENHFGWSYTTNYFLQAHNTQPYEGTSNASFTRRNATYNPYQCASPHSLDRSTLHFIGKQ